MRFRASIENVSTFFRIVQIVEKLQKKCIIKFTQKEMHIICNSDANEGGIQVWSQIKTESIFSTYLIQSNASNQITVTLVTSALLSVLKSASSLTSVDQDETIVKLAKKSGQAVLNFETQAVNSVGRRMSVGHDVRIEIMRPKDVEKLCEPLCPEPDVHILLPPLLKLRTIVDRLKPMSDTLSIQASKSGRLQISISTESVKVDTLWVGLKQPSMTDENGPSQTQDDLAHDPEYFYPALVPLRSFLKFLNSHVISNTTIACICEKHCVILYVYVGDTAEAGAVLTFYIPAVVDI